jgi:hypothetical protein
MPSQAVTSCVASLMACHFRRNVGVQTQYELYQPLQCTIATYCRERDMQLYRNSLVTRMDNPEATLSGAAEKLTQLSFTKLLAPGAAFFRPAPAATPPTSAAAHSHVKALYSTRTNTVFNNVALVQKLSPAPEFLQPLIPHRIDRIDRIDLFKPQYRGLRT